MFKKFLFIICLAIFLCVGFIFGIQYFLNNDGEDINAESESENTLSSTYVTDNCINEWADYASYVQEELEETGINLR